MNDSILHKIWNRIIRATKTNDAQVHGVVFFWCVTTLGLLARERPILPVLFCISAGSIWVVIAFLMNLIDPLD